LSVSGNYVQDEMCVVLEFKMLIGRD